eukprot:1160705-Pelagomonas_calceolata.AAC.1
MSLVLILTLLFSFFLLFTLCVTQRHVHLIEIKYWEGMRPGHQLEAAQRQHADLCKLTSAKVVTLQTILLGVGETCYREHTLNQLISGPPCLQLSCPCRQRAVGLLVQLGSGRHCLCSFKSLIPEPHDTPEPVETEGLSVCQASVLVGRGDDCILERCALCKSQPGPTIRRHGYAG